MSSSDEFWSVLLFLLLSYIYWNPVKYCIKSKWNIKVHVTVNDNNILIKSYSNIIDLKGVTKACDNCDSKSVTQACDYCDRKVY